MSAAAGAVVALSDDAFDAQLAGAQGVVLVDFGAEWCGPCRMVAPVVEALAAEYAGRATVAQVDVDASPRTAARFQVRSLPTFLFFRDGAVVDTVVGAVPRPVLEAKLREHL